MKISNVCIQQLFLEPEWALSEIAHEAEGKTSLARKTRFSHRCFGFQSRRFSLLVGHNI